MMGSVERTTHMTSERKRSLIYRTVLAVAATLLVLLATQLLARALTRNELLLDLDGRELRYVAVYTGSVERPWMAGLGAILALGSILSFRAALRGPQRPLRRSRARFMAKPPKAPPSLDLGSRPA